MELSRMPLFSMDILDFEKERIGPGDGGFENMVGPRIMRKRGKRAYTLT